MGKLEVVVVTNPREAQVVQWLVRHVVAVETEVRFLPWAFHFFFFPLLYLDVSKTSDIDKGFTQGAPFSELTQDLSFCPVRPKVVVRVNDTSLPPFVCDWCAEKYEVLLNGIQTDIECIFLLSNIWIEPGNDARSMNLSQRTHVTAVRTARRSDQARNLTRRCSCAGLDGQKGKTYSCSVVHSTSKTRDCDS